MDIRKSETPALELIRKLFMVNAHEVQQGGLKIMYMDRILYDIITKIIRHTVVEAFFHSGTGHPHREATGMMVAPVIAFGDLAL